MKERIARCFAIVSVTTLLTGCAWEVGGGPQHVTKPPTAGQQLIDLQKAKEAGAITDAEYQTKKAKILEGK